MPNFLIADDHSVVRSGLVIIIKNLYKDALTFQAGSFKEITTVLSDESIDVLILDISFPEGNSLSIISNIKLDFPNLKILMFTSYDEDVYALRYLKAGADGYLSKLSSPAEIEVAVLGMIRDGRYTSAKIKDKIIDSFMFSKPENPLEELSDREMEIATLLVNGMGNLEISTLLKLKATTISTYKTRIFEKLNISNLSSLIQIFSLHND